MLPHVTLVQTNSARIILLTESNCSALGHLSPLFGFLRSRPFVLLRSRTFVLGGLLAGYA